METNNGLEVNAQLTRWFVSFAEFSCSYFSLHMIREKCEVPLSFSVFFLDKYLKLI